MAKGNDAAYNSFLADIKAINPAVEELLKDEKVSAKLREGVLARSEFSSQMDALKSEREAFEAFQLKEKQKIDGWQSWYTDTTKDVATMQEKLKGYVDKYGDLTADGKAVAAQSGISEADFTKRLNDEIQKHDIAALKFVDDLTDIKLQHKDLFKEKLDTGALYKLAGEKNLPLDLAYKEFIAPRVEELNKQSYDAAIAKAKEEGAQEYASKHNLPVLDSRPDYVHVLDVKNPLTNTKDRVGAAVKDFAEQLSNRR